MDNNRTSELTVVLHLFFQVHVSEKSTVPDHCPVHALSDKNQPVFASKCSHVHDHLCSSCQDLNSTLVAIKSFVESTAEKLPSDERDDIMFTCQQAIAAIGAWKQHQIRSIQQDKARTDILDALDDASVLITQDWAMKFLPQKYRETQTDWFGKRGISWHISVAVKRSTSGKLQHQVFVHIVENSSQDTDVVVPIMRSVLTELKKQDPKISSASYRQDNAGCYHSGAMVAACCLLEESTGVKVERVDFSDPQGGKGICDRKAATIKSHVRRYINEGHDVVNAKQLKDAILSNGGVRGVRVALVDGRDIKPLQSIKIVGISTLNNFVICNKEITAWKAYVIGEGKIIPWAKLEGK